MLKAYMSLYEATFELDWLEKASAIAENMLSCFGTRKRGLFSSRDQMRNRSSFEKKKCTTVLCLLATAPHSSTPSHAKQTDRTSGLARHIRSDVPSLLCRCLFISSGHTAFLQELLSQYATKEKSSFSEKMATLKKNSFYRRFKNDFMPFDIILTAETGQELAKLAPLQKITKQSMAKPPCIFVKTTKFAASQSPISTKQWHN
ncbi:hypothetical protein ACEQPO_00880 [Bacillus sp. SL00103]